MNYDVNKHPVCGPLFKGGPAELARMYDLLTEGEYVDECHFCFMIRSALIDKFPQYIGPKQVYGLK
jgi:hypothetical protein